MFNDIDFSEPIVVILFLAILIASFILVAIILFIAYKLRLFIPKTKLLEDAYVKKSFNNYHKFTIFNRFILILLLITDIVFAVKANNNGEASMILFISLGLTPVFINMVFRNRSVSGSILNDKSDFERQIYQKKILIEKRNDKIRKKKK